MLILFVSSFSTSITGNERMTHGTAFEEAESALRRLIINEDTKRFEVLYHICFGVC